MAKFEEGIIINWLGENVSNPLLGRDIFQLDVT
jgi:hypothetical protein